MDMKRRRSQLSRRPAMSAGGHARPPTRLIRATILLLGLIVPQAVLIGPSLIGQQILLPLDLLGLPGVYLPAGQFRGPLNSAPLYSDLVLQLEPNRLFAAREVRAGRLPLWNPYNY